MKIKVKSKVYEILPSKKKNKKYDVFINDKYLLSFGDDRYEQYFDKFKHYANLNHLDDKRRKNYRARHKNTNINDPNSPAFWSWNFLW